MIMLALLDLPIEVVANVVKHVRLQRDLAALYRTNKLLRILAEKQLFDSVVIRLGKFDSFVQAVESHELQVRHLVMRYDEKDDDDDDDMDGSPCEIAPWVEKFQNLESLHLHGGYWYWNDELDDDPDWGVKWETHQGRMEDVLRRSSLQQPVETRLLPRLHSCILDFQEQNAQAWCLGEFKAVLLIPQLHDLRIVGVKLYNEDGDNVSGFRGTTDLKILHIENTYINIRTLGAFLAVPKALTHLTLNHEEMMNHHEMGGFERQLSFRDLEGVFLQQRESLVVLDIQGDLPTEGEYDRRYLNLSTFPKLERYNGPFMDISGRKWE